MNDIQEYYYLFDEDVLTTDMIIVNKELLRLAEEKLNQDSGNTTLQQCVQYRKDRLKKLEGESGNF